MHEAIGKRELIVLDGLGVRIQGTYHPASERSSESPSSRGGRDLIGVLFVNSLSLPRAASGDSAVHWADSIAELGYPAFRIDLPGLGDSEGKASTDLLDSVNAGGFASVVASTVGQLVDRFGLSGMVIFGHCAGSVSALYASASSPACKGVILLDAYFHLPQATRPRVRQELSDWARRSRIGRFLSNSYDRARNLRLVLRGSSPPANANTQLLACWKQVSTAGLPILLLQAPGIKAQGSKPRVGEFDYIEHVTKLAGRKSRVSIEFVESADHSFANRKGRAAVQSLIGTWLVSHFPLTEFNMSARDVSSLRTSNSPNEPGKIQTAPVEGCCALEGR
jgi:pimeloyl-ACP methyl ester carboxylesterase